MPGSAFRAQELALRQVHLLYNEKEVYVGSSQAKGDVGDARYDFAL